MATDKTERNKRLGPLLEEMVGAWTKIANEYQGNAEETLRMLVSIFAHLAKPLQDTSDIGGIASIEVENIAVAVASHDVGKRLSEWCIKMENEVRTAASNAGIKGFSPLWDAEEQTDAN